MLLYQKQSMLATRILIKSFSEYVHIYIYMCVYTYSHLYGSVYEQYILNKESNYIKLLFLGEKRSFPPSRTSTPGGVQGKPGRSSMIPDTVPQTALSAALRETSPQHPIPH